ncbi:MAG: hypothetical protein IJ962_06655, partial [Clostridia bacterium]|nr:hypothetical protein [Clostridia bacterium]
VKGAPITAKKLFCSYPLERTSPLRLVLSRGQPEHIPAIGAPVADLFEPIKKGRLYFSVQPPQHYSVSVDGILK